MELLLNLEGCYLHFKTSVVANRLRVGDEEYFDRLVGFSIRFLWGNKVGVKYSSSWGWPDIKALATSCLDFSLDRRAESFTSVYTDLDGENDLQVVFDNQDGVAYLKIPLANENGEITSHSLTITLSRKNCADLAIYLRVRSRIISKQEAQVQHLIDNGTIIEYESY